MEKKTDHSMPDQWRSRRVMAWGAVACVVAAGVIYAFGGVIKLVIVSALLAYILDPVTTSLESKGLSRTLATIVVFLAISGTLALGILLLYPVITHELQVMQTSGSGERTTEILASLESSIQDRFGFLGIGELDLDEKVQQLKRWAGERMIDFFVTDLASLVGHLVAIPFMMFFFLKDGREMKRMLIRRVPNRYFEFSLNLLYRMDRHLGNYLRGQFLDALSFGVLATLALWILDVRFAVFLGAFAGTANLIPYVGPIAGGLLSAIVALLDTGDLVAPAYVALAFVVIKLIDDAVIQPLTVARSVEMHPLLVLLVIIVGGQAFGILGMLLSVPVVGFVRIAVEESITAYRKYRFL